MVYSLPLSHRHHNFYVIQFWCPAWLSTFLRIDLKVVFQRSSSRDFKFLIREHHGCSQVLVFRHKASPVSHVNASSLQVSYSSSFLPVSLVLEKLNLFLQIYVVVSPITLNHFLYQHVCMSCHL